LSCHSLAVMVVVVIVVVVVVVTAAAAVAVIIVIVVAPSVVAVVVAVVVVFAAAAAVVVVVAIVVVVCSPWLVVVVAGQRPGSWGGHARFRARRLQRHSAFCVADRRLHGPELVVVGQPAQPQECVGADLRGARGPFLFFVRACVRVCAAVPV
jgi:hypothetical protein